MGKDQAPIQSVTVRLDISGTWTGDLYAYLNFGGAHAVLLNRTGTTAVDAVGYGDPGVQVRLWDGAPNGDVHSYRLTLSGDATRALTGPLTGDWAPDGRTTDPEVVRATDPRSALLGAFRGTMPDGMWTLFVADLAPGSVHYLDGWGLELTLIPEPAASLVLTGVGCLLWVLVAKRARPRHVPLV